MPKKTSLLIIILAITTGILVFVAIRNENLKKTNISTEDNVNEEPSVKPFANLEFSVQTLLLAESPTNTESVDIVIDTDDKPVFGTQIELSYDPEIVTNIEVTNPDGSFFGENAEVLIERIDEEQGRITYAISLPQQEEEKSGYGVIARLNFSVDPSATGESTITFLPKTSVTTLKTPSSVLNGTKPLTLILSE